MRYHNRPVFRPTVTPAWVIQGDVPLEYMKKGGDFINK